MMDNNDALPGIAAAVLAKSPFSAAELNRRSGHDAIFLGADLPLPLPPASASDTWLHYTHFSILLDRARRQARLTVVDIDGAKWREIRRKKGDKWYPDPRVDKDQQPEKRFFETADPRFNPDHNDFGYGHMVRRQDPNWQNDGEAHIAEQSERETFHLTNAAPQAEKLNSGPWNDLENVVLDDLKKNLKIRAVVLTGPIFDDSDPRIFDTFQIPRQFWKLVAWRAGNRLAAVAWKQGQTPGTLPTPAEAPLPFDNQVAEHWLVPVREIEHLTGLDLATYVAADTYLLRRPPGAATSEATEQPPRLPRSASDLLLADLIPPDDTLPAILGLPRAEIEARQAAMADREREIVDDELPAVAEDTEAARGPSPAELAQRVSQEAFGLIVQHETGGRTYYEKVYKKRPVWPLEKSGITIGFGYDLGYVSAAEFARDWRALPAADRAALAATIGHHGGNSAAPELNAMLAQVKHIIIEWDLAQSVFKAVTLPKFAAATNRALPNCSLLSGDCFGALVSLTFNRGASYSRAADLQNDPKDRYREMRAVLAAMKARDFAAIPNQICAMKRVWLGTAIEAEMNRRRENEAKLFEAGLAVA